MNERWRQDILKSALCIVAKRYIFSFAKPSGIYVLPKMDYPLKWRHSHLDKTEIESHPHFLPHPFPLTIQRWKSKLFPAGPCALCPPGNPSAHSQPGTGYTGYSCLSGTYCAHLCPRVFALTASSTFRCCFSPHFVLLTLGQLIRSWFHVTYLLMPPLAILPVIRGCYHILWFKFLPRKLTSLVLIVYLYIVCFLLPKYNLLVRDFVTSYRTRSGI